jgi:8-amino-7-oxononanoate synthase
VTGVLDLFVSQVLDDLDGRGLRRIPDDGSARDAAATAAAAIERGLIDASSNDYLGLSDLDVSRETGVQVGPPGAGASRLIHGTRQAQVRLEQQLAHWVRLPAALLFASGYAANVGLLSALGESDTVIFSDRLNHASIIDGSRLSRARVEVLPHLDLKGVENALTANRSARARWVVTESCFSMDGDGPDLRALRTLCDQLGAALLVDEAHALGIFGPKGAGRCAEAGIVPDALIGTLGKAIGTQGAFVAGSLALREFLWNRARSFVFSTATSPLLAARTLLHVERVQAADDLRARVRALAAQLRARLQTLGIQVEPGLDGPIIPIVVGDNETSLRTAAALAAAGILAQAIRPPTVPPGGARLRLTVSAAWPDDAVELVATATARALGVLR